VQFIHFQSKAIVCVTKQSLHASQQREKG